MKTLALNSGHPSIPLTSLKGKIHFGGQHKYILSRSTNTFSQARKYIHLTANNFFGLPQIYNSIAWPASNDCQFSWDRYIFQLQTFFGDRSHLFWILWTENIIVCLLMDAPMKRVRLPRTRVFSLLHESSLFCPSLQPLCIHLWKANHFSSQEGMNFCFFDCLLMLSEHCRVHYHHPRVNLYLHHYLLPLIISWIVIQGSVYLAVRFEFILLQL